MVSTVELAVDSLFYPVLKVSFCTVSYHRLTLPRTLILSIGGYTKVYEGKRVTGMALSDTWLLKVPPMAESGELDFKKFKWERKKKIGYAPSTRSGCTMALWASKNIGVLFGGVCDDDKDEETLESTFYNEL